MKRVCVYLGSSPGANPAYLRTAEELGRVLSRRGLGLVYGGGNIGLMGTLAKTVLAGGGEVIGVIPRFMTERELAYEGVTELRVVDSMHERKAEMAATADAFATLPGGIGTLEELTETFTWAQLGLHAKPIGLLNVGGYYDPLLAFLDHAVAEGFVKPEHREALVVEREVERLLDRLAEAARGNGDAGALRSRT